MRYEGPDVNKLISNGLLQAGSMLDKGRPESATAPVAPRNIGTNETAPKASLIRNDRTPTVITLGVQITGSIELTEELHIHGSIKGNVRASAVTIFKGGIVKGEVFADSITVQGNIEGTLQGKKVQLNSTAVVSGDVLHEIIGIEPGAVFEGALKRMPAPVANDTDVSEAA